MARLRVPASSVKGRQATSTYAAYSHQENDRSSYETRAKVLMNSDDGEQASETSALPKLSIRSPIKGSVKSLTSMSRATKSDVQGYIVGQYQAVDKVGHELIDRTGTKVVFFLGQDEDEEEDEEATELLDDDMSANLGEYVNEEEDEDQSWNELQDFIRENSTTETASSTKAKSPSFARCMASAGVDDANSDLDSDSDDDELDLSQKIERAVSKFAQKIEECEEDGKEYTNITRSHNDYLVYHPPMMSPLEAIDIPYPCKSKESFGNRRHSGGKSLAFLMARAGDVFTSPEEDDRLPWSTSTSSSPSSSPIPSPNASGMNLSADDALAMLRERFRIAHHAGGGTSCSCREWLDAKAETGCSMVHGPSLLRFSTNCYEHGQSPLTETANTPMQLDLQNVTFRVRIAPSKDTLKTKSSMQTSAFSKCTSVTSMSSYQTHRPQSANDEHHLHIDATVMDVDKPRVEEVEQLFVPLHMSAEDTRKMLPAVVIQETNDFEEVREQTVDCHDDVATDFDETMEPGLAIVEATKSLQRKWINKMKHFIQKLPKKSKQATRDCFRATKKFSRTAWNFAPAAVWSRRSC
ncbi:hypothetical protein ACET3X_002860 [Alternaria dauci]|uniref:Uncharacterized protein n=1 Tax=Alternaria dauci TaxID=48095 RepID=A0ABR3URX0_9PLEO